MDTADSLNKMLEEKLAEAEKEIIKDKEKVLSKKPSLVLFTTHF